VKKPDPDDVAYVADVFKQSQAIVERLWPIIEREFGGVEPTVQGAVLADLTAIFIFGHTLVGAPKNLQRKLWDDLNTLQSAQVRTLVSFYEKNGINGEK
jgi:hypothetical protein